MTETQSAWQGSWRDSSYPLYKALFFFVVYLLCRFVSSSKVRRFYAKVSDFLNICLIPHNSIINNCLQRRMDGKTVIVTGATGGIGKETSKYLARTGARVILACRNVKLAEQVKNEIIAESSNPNVVVRPLDLCSFKSIRAFAKQINETEERLDVLVHNAGYANAFKKAVSEDGLEKTMATNHYGPFLLTHLLIDLLKKSAPSRVVVVASSLYIFAKVNLDNLNPKNTFPGYLYYVSKCANIMFAQELARRLEGTGVTANSLHPGIVDTGIWDTVPFPLNLPFKLVRMCFKTPEEGCQTSVFCAVSEELDGQTGKYYSDNREATLLKRVVDEKRNLTLWEESAKLVGLKDDDPKI